MKFTKSDIENLYTLNSMFDEIILENGKQIGIVNEFIFDFVDATIESIPYNDIAFVSILSYGLLVPRSKNAFFKFINTKFNMYREIADASEINFSEYRKYILNNNKIVFTVDKLVINDEVLIDLGAANYIVYNEFLIKNSIIVKKFIDYSF